MGSEHHPSKAPSGEQPPSSPWALLSARAKVGLGFRVQGLGFFFQGLGFRVQGLGFRAPRAIEKQLLQNPQEPGAKPHAQVSALGSPLLRIAGGNLTASP